MARIVGGNIFFLVNENDQNDTENIGDSALDIQKQFEVIETRTSESCKWEEEQTESKVKPEVTLRHVVCTAPVILSIEEFNPETSRRRKAKAAILFQQKRR